MLRQFLLGLFPFILFCAAPVALGESRLFQVRDVLKPASAPDAIFAVTATNRVQKTLRPGLELRFFVDDSLWNSSQPMGLDSEFSSVSTTQRLLVLEQVAEALRSIHIPFLEALAHSLQLPQNPALDGLNFLFLDLIDGFSANPAEDQRKGSYLGARFEPLDQNGGSGLNRMNLIYVDLNPGTFARELSSGIKKNRSWIELIRSVARLLLYQKDSLEDNFILEGLAQHYTLRTLNQKPFPDSQERILSAPQNPISDVVHYLNRPFMVYPGLVIGSDSLDRVFVETTPRIPLDNRLETEFKGFVHLFFNYLWLRTGGNTETSNSAGDQFLRNLGASTLTGTSGLQSVLQANSLSLPVMLDDFYLSLFQSQQEDRFKHTAVNLTSRTFIGLPSVAGFGSQVELQLEPMQAGAVQLNGGTGLSLRTVLIRPLGGLEQQTVYLLNRSLQGFVYPEQDLGTLARQKQTSVQELSTLLASSDDKALLFVNQTTGRRQFSISVPSQDQVSTRGLVIVASNQAFGTVSTALEVESSDVPALGTTKPINVSVSGAGLFEIVLSNKSTSTLAVSLGANSPETGLTLQGYQPQSLSLGSTLAATVDRRIIVSQGSRQTLLLIHERPQNQSFSLQLEAVNPSLIVQSGTVTSSGGSSISHEEFLKVAGGGGGGCFVATAAFGGSSRIVRDLSLFRDQVLLKSEAGEKFVRWYYETSPAVAEQIRGSMTLRLTVKLLLMPLWIVAWMFLHPGIALLFLGVLLTRRVLGPVPLILLLGSLSPMFAASGVQSALTTAQISDIADTLVQVTRRGFETYGFAQPPFSNTTDNTINVVLYDIIDGVTNPAVQVGAYFSPIDQLRVQSLSERNRQSNFGNVIYVDLNPLNPLLKRSSLQGSNLTSASLYANQQVFYQKYARALARLIQFQALNPTGIQTSAALLSSGIWLEDDRWLSEALATLASWRFLRGNEIVFNVQNALRAFEQGQPAELLLDGSSGLEAPLELGFLLHYPQGIPWPSLFFADNILTGVLGPNPAVLNEQDNFLLQASYGLGFITFLYIWEQLTTEGRARPDRVQDLGDQFLRELLKGPGTVIAGTGRTLPTFVSASDQNPCANPNSSRVCSIDSILIGKIQAERCQTRATRTCFEQFFLDMAVAIFQDREPLADYTGAQKYEIRNFDLARMDIENNRNVPSLGVGNRAGINFSTLDPISDDYNREQALLNASLQTDTTTSVGPATSLTISGFSLGFVGMTNRNSKSDVDFLYVDAIDQISDGRLDCRPVSVVSRLILSQQVSRSVTCAASPGTTVFAIPKSSGVGAVTTAVAVFAAVTNTALTFETVRVSQGGLIPFEPEVAPPAVARIRPNVSSEVRASISGIVPYKDKQVLETVDPLDPSAAQKYTVSFRTVNFSRSTTSVLFVEERAAILKARREIPALIAGGIPMELLVWVDQNYLPAAEFSTPNPPITVPDAPTTVGFEQVIFLDQNILQTQKELLNSVKVPGRTTMTLRIQNQTSSRISLNFSPCNQFNECGGLVTDFFEYDCDNDPVTQKPDCSSFSDLAVPRELDPLSTLVLPLRNRNNESSQLLSFLKVQTVNTSTQTVASQGAGRSGCFIASAVFGAEHVIVHRFCRLRDEVLLQDPTGRLLVEWYYQYSPPIALMLSHSPWWSSLTAVFLTLVWLCLEIPFLMLIPWILMMGFSQFRARRF